MKLLAQTAVLFLAAMLGMASISPSPNAAAGDTLPSAKTSGDACARLMDIALRGVTIALATSLTEGAPVPNSGLSPMFGNAPVVGKAPAAFCKVAGHRGPENRLGF